MNMDVVKIRINNLNMSIKRFPFAILASTLTTIMVIYIINVENYYNQETIELFVRLAMIFALAFPLYLSIKVFFERKKNIGKLYKVSTRLLVAVILIGYFFFFLKDFNMVTVTRYIAVNLTLYLLFLVMPYFYQNKNFELYVVKIFIRLIITFVYSVVLFVGTAAILFTINELLNVPITETFYPSAGLIIFGIFAPIFLLAKIPKHDEVLKPEEYPNILEILLIYILTPLITIYTSILYIYFIKILVTQKLPEGLVAHLVIWYASLSVIILFFIYPINHKDKWLKNFSRWLPIALIPLLLMMFLAIGIRINEYGVTENRYFVVLLGLWISGITIYYIFTKKKNNVILPLTLAIIAFLSVFGPWSSYSVSIYSQNQRFENIINKYDIVEDNTIIQNNKDISAEDQQQIQAIIRYFNNNHKLNNLKYLPADFKLTETKQLFGFSYQDRYTPESPKYFTYFLENQKRAIQIKDYDYLFHIYNNVTQIESNDAALSIKINDLDKKIIITKEGEEIYNRSLVPILNDIHRKNKGKSIEELNQEDLSYIDLKENFKVKYIFLSFQHSVENNETNTSNLNHLNFFLLIDIY